MMLLQWPWPRGTIENVLASHPAGLGLILGVRKILFSKFLEFRHLDLVVAFLLCYVT